MRYLLLLIAIAGLAAAASHERAGDLTDLERATAAKAYTSKCARCHKFYEPANYTASEWAMWMAKMKKKARLNSEQYSLLLRYTEQLRTNSPASQVPN